MAERTGVLIAGPTASGKSHLALALADRMRGVVVNADAMQVYRDLRVLTARPSAEDEAAVPHVLYGHADAAEARSVATWLREAAAAIGSAHAAGRLPIIVGGTGLYLAALTEGLARVPPVPDAVRAAWRARQHEPAETLHRELARRDPAMAARLRPSDTQRVLRALEVFDATGRSLAQWQAEPDVPVLARAGVRAIVLAPARAEVRARVATRFAAMMEAGAVEEAAALAARGLSPALPAMRAIGVRPLADYAAGRMSRDAAMAQAVTQSRQYVKRQDTFFRHRLADWSRAASFAEALALVYA